MSDDSFFTALEDEMEEMKSSENTGISIDSIFKQYKLLKDFLLSLPEKNKPKKEEKGRIISPELAFGDNKFILKNTEVNLGEEKITINDLTTNQATEYSKKGLCKNHKLLEEIARKIENAVKEYCSTTKRELEEEQKKLIKEIEDF